MDGRDLILYILSNHLEDKPVFEDGTFLGFMTIGEAAAKMDVGTATVYTMIAQGRLDAIKIPTSSFGYLIPRNSDLMLGGNNERTDNTNSRSI
jgi:excisionase family DNA binding protein